MNLAFLDARYEDGSVASSILSEALQVAGSNSLFEAFQPMWLKNDLAEMVPEWRSAWTETLKEFLSPFGAALIAILWEDLSHSSTTV